MTACTNEDLVPQTEALKLTEGELIEKISFTTPDLEVDDASTRGFYKGANGNMTFYWSTYADALLKADTIGVFPIRGNERADQIFFPVAETTNSNTAFFDGLGWGLRTGYTYGAYYPYDFNNRNFREIKVDYTGQRLLTNNSTVLLSRHDFMVSNQIKPTTNELSIPLKRLGAIVKVELDFNDYITNLGSQAPEKIIFVDDFTLGTTENVFALHGKVSLADETPAFQPEDEELRSSSVSVALGDPNLTEQTFWTNKNNHNWKVTMFMTLPPTELAGKTLTATLKDKDGNKYVAQFDGKNLVAGKAYSFNGSVKKVCEVITNPNIIEAIKNMSFDDYFPPEYTEEGYLYVSKWIYGVQELNLSGKHDPTIADELHYFTSLQNLYLDYNDLERLDLSDLYDLRELHCNYNNLKELILPNNCEFLTGISAIDNQLTSLDLDGCSNLSYLRLESNQLSYIDLSMCSSLLYLNLADNQLTSIDLKDNGQLQSLNLLYNQLSSILVNYHPELEYICCTENHLRSLILTNPGLGLWNLSGEDLGYALLLGQQIDTLGNSQTIQVRIPSSVLDKVKSAVEEYSPILNANVEFVGV